MRYASWAWTARRLAISAFVTFHLGVTAIWVMPPCPIRAACDRTIALYLLPLGLIQFWNMFSPEPQYECLVLDAEVIDAKGMRHIHSFARMEDYSWWEKTIRFRHPKFSANVGTETEDHRRATARYAVRALKISTDAFPVDVGLFYQYRITPAPGGPPADPMTPKRPSLIASFHFTGREEVVE